MSPYSRWTRSGKLLWLCFFVVQHYFVIFTVQSSIASGAKVSYPPLHGRSGGGEGGENSRGERGSESIGISNRLEVHRFGTYKKLQSPRHSRLFSIPNHGNELSNENSDFRKSISDLYGARPKIPWQLHKFPLVVHTIWVLSHSDLCSFCQNINGYFRGKHLVESCWIYRHSSSTHKCEAYGGRNIQELGADDKSWLWLIQDEFHNRPSTEVQFSWSGPNKLRLPMPKEESRAETLGVELHKDAYEILRNAQLIPNHCFMEKDDKLFPYGHQCSSYNLCSENEDGGYNCTCITESLDNYNESSDIGVTDCHPLGSPTLRVIIVVVQIISIALTILLGVFSVLARKFKVMAMWPINISLLIGCTLLYLTVILRMQEGSSIICILEPWFREVGFAMCYGSIVLKIYRALVEFRTRKAHRWVVREKDILRYLGTIVLVAVFYLTAWTTLIWPLEGKLLCYISSWHRLNEIEELLFLAVGLNMAYHLRNAQQTHERYLFIASLVIEALVSIITIILRETIHNGSKNPQILLILYFARIHASTTVILLILFSPKIYYVVMERQKRLLRRGDTSRVVKSVLDNGAGDLDLAEVSLADMDPQDIRNELKRVYTQLEVLRNKTMRKDNPHISKRRGGRKQTHRRFSLQKKGSKDRRRQKDFNRSFRYTAGGDDNEDSVCSIEGPSTFSESGFR